ncbi:MAG: ChaN family lipoprotein [Longimicrobiales bacterium]
MASDLWRFSLALLCLSLALPLFGMERLSSQDVEYADHFRVYDGDGVPAGLEDVVRAMSGIEVVLVGEVHTDPVGHWVEAELFRRTLELVRAGEASGALRPLALSLEMFERDVQGIVDEYLQDLITESQFKASARPWEFYDEDYRPMVEAAKEKGAPAIAANAPRRYVNRVSRLGRDALQDLPPRARAVLPPLPYPPPTDAYRAEWTALMSTMTMEDQCPAPEAEEDVTEEAAPHGMEMPPHGEVSEAGGMPSGMEGFMENGLQAQTLWDASMAYAITTFLARHPGGLVVHMVGGFHVENFTGTPEKVQYYRPGTRSLVVAMEMADDITAFDPEEHAGKGDFVILTDQALDKNYERNCVQE